MYVNAVSYKLCAFLSPIYSVLSVRKLKALTLTTESHQLTSLFLYLSIDL